MASFSPLVSEANVALRYLDLRYGSPVYYIHHLPTYIRSTRVEEIMLTFSIPCANSEDSDMRDEWSTLDAMITGALVAYPRQSFVLHIYMPSLPKPAGEECA